MTFDFVSAKKYVVGTLKKYRRYKRERKQHATLWRATWLNTHDIINGTDTGPLLIHRIVKAYTEQQARRIARAHPHYTLVKLVSLKRRRRNEYQKYIILR